MASISLKYPSGSHYIYALTFFERFSFYGLRAVLVFFLLEQLNIDSAETFEIYASCLALHFMTPLLGGWLGDNFLGNQRMIYLSGLVMGVGFVFLIYPYAHSFYFALGAVILGSGCFRSNLISLFGKLYEKKNEARDAGFTYFQVVSNIAVVVGPLICGLVIEFWGWTAVFWCLAISTLITLWVLYRARVSFGYHGREPSATSRALANTSHNSVKAFFIIVLIIFIPLLGFLIWQNEWLGMVVPIVTLCAVILLFYYGLTQKILGKMLMIFFLMIFFLMIFMVGFLALFEQSKMLLLLFINSNADRSFEAFLGPNLGQLFSQYHEIPPIVFRSMNGIFVIILGPLYAYYWNRLTRRKKNPIPTVKFGIGLFLAAIAFAFLAFSRHYSSEDGFVSLWWVVATYFFYTAGELCIIPIGLSAITRIAPNKISGVVVGTWLLAGAIAYWVSKAIGHFLTPPAEAYNAMCTLTTYCDHFGMLAWISFALSLIILLVSPFTRRFFASIK